MVSKGFPNVTVSGQHNNIREKPSVILYTYINHRGGTPKPQSRSTASPRVQYSLIRLPDYRRARKVVSPRPILVFWTRRLRTPTQSAHTYPIREQCRRWKHKLRPCHSSSRVPLAYTDPSGERQQAPSTPQQWGPPSLHHRPFRRATASTVHAAAGSV